MITADTFVAVTPKLSAQCLIPSYLPKIGFQLLDIYETKPEKKEVENFEYYADEKTNNKNSLLFSNFNNVNSLLDESTKYNNYNPYDITETPMTELETQKFLPKFDLTANGRSEFEINVNNTKKGANKYVAPKLQSNKLETITMDRKPVLNSSIEQLNINEYDISNYQDTSYIKSVNKENSLGENYTQFKQNNLGENESTRINWLVPKTNNITVNNTVNQTLKNKPNMDMFIPYQQSPGNSNAKENYQTDYDLKPVQQIINEYITPISGSNNKYIDSSKDLSSKQVLQKTYTAVPNSAYKSTDYMNNNTTLAIGKQSLNSNYITPASGIEKSKKTYLDMDIRQDKRDYNISGEVFTTSSKSRNIGKRDSTTRHTKKSVTFSRDLELVPNQTSNSNRISYKNNIVDRKNGIDDNKNTKDYNDINRFKQDILILNAQRKNNPYIKFEV